MTRVDFYLLPESLAAEAVPRDGAMATICKLCDKAAQGGSRTYVFAPQPETASTLDTLLWSFRQGSFISHERLGATPPETPAPWVLIGASEPPAGYEEVMINLGDEVPPFFSRFERVLEIVDGDEATRARSRERYRYYRDRGYELKMNKL